MILRVFRSQIVSIYPRLKGIMRLIVQALAVVRTI